jgi:hypothetical protein
MTSPDERFDDAFEDERLSRGLWQLHGPEPFIFLGTISGHSSADNIKAAMSYIAHRYRGRMTCAHCGISSTAPDCHVCETAILDWVWADTNWSDNQRLATVMRFRQANPVLGLRTA